MTEAEFFSRARYGTSEKGSSPVKDATFYQALADFLRSHGFHDMARAVEYDHPYGTRT